MPAQPGRADRGLRRVRSRLKCARRRRRWWCNYGTSTKRLWHRLDRIIAKLAQRDETARRLGWSIPGFGPITASAMAATIQDTSSFRRAPREFAAFLGLTPKQNSSGGKPKLGRISKMGNRNLRKLLVVGAHAVLFHRKPHTDPLRDVGQEADREETLQARRRCARQQDGAHRLRNPARGKTVYREIPA